MIFIFLIQLFQYTFSRSISRHYSEIVSPNILKISLACKITANSNRQRKFISTQNFVFQHIFICLSTKQVLLAWEFPACSFDILLNYWFCSESSHLKFPYLGSMCTALQSLAWRMRRDSRGQELLLSLRNPLKPKYFY